MLGQSAPESLKLGQLGSTYIADTSAHTGGRWGIIEATTATVIASVTSGNLVDGTTCMQGTLTNISLSAGAQLRGIFTAITLTSGAVVCYDI